MKRFDRLNQAFNEINKLLEEMESDINFLWHEMKSSNGRGNEDSVTDYDGGYGETFDEFMPALSIPITSGTNRRKYGAVISPKSPLIKRVPRDILGHGVLGRAFPLSGIIEIADDLYGDEYYEVLLHEMIHIENPQLSEYDVRALTRLRFGKPTRFQ